VLVYFFTHALRLTVPPLVCAVVAVVWGLGLLKLLGFGPDPMTILVPFLVFAIGVSHSGQVVSAVSAEVGRGRHGDRSRPHGFRRLVVPGAVAVLTSTIGFLTLLLIDVQMVQELALTGRLGVAVMTLTSLSLLPVVLSYLSFTRPVLAYTIVGTAILLTGAALWQARDVPIGDTQAGRRAGARIALQPRRHRDHRALRDRRGHHLGDRRDRSRRQGRDHRARRRSRAGIPAS
jgi:uncharacterized membrane protein YdfJ with MMPL/SSD domain